MVLLIHYRQDAEWGREEEINDRVDGSCGLTACDCWLHDGANGQVCWNPMRLNMGILENLDFMQRHQPTADHLLQMREEATQAIRLIDDVDDNWRIGGPLPSSIGVQSRTSPISGDGSRDRGSCTTLFP